MVKIEKCKRCGNDAEYYYNNKFSNESGYFCFKCLDSIRSDTKTFDWIKLGFAKKISTMIGKTSFVKILGDSITVRIFDFLLGERNIYSDYSMSEISEGSDVSLMKTNEIIVNLIKIGIVKNTRKVGKAEMFSLNEENPIVKSLIEFDKTISNYFIEKELESSSNGH